MSTAVQTPASDSTSSVSSAAPPAPTGPLGGSFDLRLATTTFLGAFLLFQVQPLISKALLPWYGGTPAVWTTSLLFFQWLLVAGYAFAHGMVRYLRPATRTYVFILAAVAAACLLPIRPGLAWRPSADVEPVRHLLWLLLVCVGGPYFVLSSTAPTTQEWFRRGSGGQSVYRLYALSNAGSLLGLLTYPFLVERMLSLQEQSIVWSAAFVAFIAVAGSCAWSVRGRGEPAERSGGRAVRKGTTEAAGADAAAIRPLEAAQWIALAAGGTIVLMSATQFLCQDVAPVPFLWVAPLAVYLLTFIIGFDHPRWYRRSWYAAAALFLLPWAALQGVPFATLERSTAWPAATLLRFRDISFVGQTTVILAMLGAVCMLCHGELAARKPSARHSTLYFLLVSLGGALGGFFVAVVAPSWFDRNWEWILGTTAALVLAAVVLGQSLRKAGVLVKPIFVGAYAAAALAVVAVLVWFHAMTFNPNQIDADRNFYGTVSIDAGADMFGDPLYVSMRSGTTFHGVQILVEGHRNRPTAYFSENSGVGITLREAGRAGRPLRVGVIGLGVGTLAAYGQPGDVYDFFEINPVVERFAGEYFSFLRDSPAQCRVVLGDARTSLERALEESGGELPPEAKYDVIVLDAFTGDSIPTHLLTAEAIELYLKYLRDDGIIAAHISNSHLDLAPVLAAAAAGLNLTAVEGSNRGNPKEFVQPARWALLTRRPDTELWGTLRKRGFGALKQGKTVRLWTDDHNSQYEILK